MIIVVALLVFSLVVVLVFLGGAKRVNRRHDQDAEAEAERQIHRG